MIDLIVAGASYLFPVGRALKLIKAGVKVTNSTNPLIATKNITLMVLDCCTPPPVKLVAHCVAGGSLVVASVVSPNPVTIGSAVHIIKEIYDDC